MSRKLNKISSQMEFGHTNYVPSDETRNFSALFPSADVLTTRLQNKPSVEISADMDSYTPEQIKEFDSTITGNTLLSDNYRKLAWDGQLGELTEPEITYPSMDTCLKRPAKHSVALELPTQSSVITDIPELEAFYRGSSSTAFRIDPMACHLIDQSAALAQDRKLKYRLGNSVILLNDPVYTNWLRNMVYKEVDEIEDSHCNDRADAELVRDAMAKKKGRYVVDDLFNAMHLPEICETKPWLPQSKFRRKSGATTVSSRKTEPASTPLPSLMRADEGSQRLFLPLVDQTQSSPSTQASGEVPATLSTEDLKLPSIFKDRLSETENIDSMFERAESILQNPDEYTQFKVKSEAENTT